MDRYNPIPCNACPMTRQEIADRLLRDYQAGRALPTRAARNHRALAWLERARPVVWPRVTATVNPFPSFEAAKASDMQRVKL